MSDLLDIIFLVVKCNLIGQRILDAACPCTMGIVPLFQRVGTILNHLIWVIHIYQVRCFAYHHVVVAIETTVVAQIAPLLLPCLRAMLDVCLEVPLLIAAAMALTWRKWRHPSIFLPGGNNLACQVFC